ncbi:MAG: hypothetical protein QM610_11470 [Chitinophagaceae bacterium]
MAYAVIELLTLILHLTRHFAKPLLSVVAFPVAFVERWLGSTFAFLFGFVRLENANVLPKALAISNIFHL